MKKKIPKPTYFGVNLKLLRRMHGFTQTELAKILEVKRNNIASYESGMVEPNALFFIRTCQYFDIEPKEMLGTILSQNPISNTMNLSNNIETIDHYFIDQFEIFVQETNNSTKIIEGFNAFRNFDERTENSEEKVLSNILSDLLSIFDTLLKTNWDLIHNVIPTEETDS